MSDLKKNTQAMPMIPCESIGLSSVDTLSYEQQLHTTLEIERVCHLFFELCQQHLKITGFQYQNPAAEIELSLGQTDSAIANFQLSFQDHALGECTLFRSTCFSPSESERCQQLCSLLLVPLHNALIYQAAVFDALKDPLTGVLNRSALLPTIEREIEHSKRHQIPLSLLLIDLDNFKKMNDTFGHLMGDALLRHTSQLFMKICRQEDTIFRYGGEEFIILLKHTKKIGALQLANRMRETIANTPCLTRGHALTVTTSIGITTLREKDSIEHFISRADEAMYQAKEQGKNCCIFIA